MLEGLTILIVLQLAGEILAGLTRAPVPGPVIGLALLVGYALWRGALPKAVEEAGDGILRHLSLLFVPAGVGGLDLPVEVSAIDSFPSVTDAPERSLSIVARIGLDLSDVYMTNDASVAQALDRCKHVSLYLLERADAWLDDEDDDTI